MQLCLTMPVRALQTDLPERLAKQLQAEFASCRAFRQLSAVS